MAQQKLATGACLEFDPPPSTGRIMTPPTTIDNDPYMTYRGHNIAYSIPSPGSTYLIRSVSDGRVITELDGGVVLASEDSLGSKYWRCREFGGRLRFENRGSGLRLGANPEGILRCTVPSPAQCFTLFPSTKGGHVLVMFHKTDFVELWHVGIAFEGGVERLATVGPLTHGTNYITWEFIEVK